MSQKEKPEPPPLHGCRFGIWADWQDPYVTLQPAYEAAQLSVFGRMFLNGHIYRRVAAGVQQGV